MTLYSYKAIRPDGQTEEGEMEAADEMAVVLALQGQGLIPLETRGAGGISGWFKNRGRRQVGLDAVGLVPRELATLLESGLPLDRSLQVLIELNEDDAELNELLSDVRAGRNGTGSDREGDGAPDGA